ncbi:PREDICTED: nuclear transcription factor Y subunit B-3-like [Papilio xuthus]|uniref:Nuclear transcription factor Y subunit B-2 n=1 Tax=Papilio xuthus TaxID=66420 RepID=A0A194Q7U0_PAPXU|nr:PREDICTED: nuclear transcription factor Y subunit B-3-like [Papilio xuthus]KPJ01588.1 Nuclear transcription factor Y subunit B-2 [Papilio xuthus]
MESDDLGNEIVRLDNGFMVDEEETFVVNSDDVLEQEENNSDSNCGGKNVPLREQDRFLPIANIAKIMKRAIPENGKIAKDARECVQECISEFISFITSEASDRCQMEKRKTINGEDVLFAMNQLGFENYVDPLKIYLKKYREIVLSPVTINKLNKAYVLSSHYREASTSFPENENETKTETVLYSYQKGLGDFNIN